MTRKWFIILLPLPLLLIYPVLTLELELEWMIMVFVISCLYIWTLYFIRLRFLGFTWKQCIIGFFTGVAGKIWWKAWQKDPEKNAGSESSLRSL